MGTNFLMTAEEANAKTKETIEKTIALELAEIDELVREAIANGKFTVNTGMRLNDEICNKLKELGYSTTETECVNGCITTISWG